MKILDSAGGGAGRQPEFVSTHPNPGNRIDRLENIIDREYPDGVPDRLELGKNSFDRIVAPRL